MRRKIAIVFVLLFSITAVFASKYHSIPIGDKGYRIVETAQLRGIIPVQSEVKPYSLSVMRELLNDIRNSELISNAERDVVDSVLREYDRLYGSEKVNSFRDFLNNGFLRFGDSETNLTVGGSFKTKNVVGFNFSDGKVIDTRNQVLFYLRGDLFDILSYDANLGLHVEKINTNAYLPMDFPIDMSGNYFEFPRNDIYNLNNDAGILWGFSANPEVDMSFINNKVGIRFASIKRNWGPSENNLGLSASASTMAGLEINVKPFDWFEYTVMHASLTKFALSTFKGVDWPSDIYARDEYNNNFSMHRIDLKFGGLRFGVFENVVWRKRFELAYLNPFAIYQIIQNEVSDYDNMMFGFDVSYTFKNLGKIYFSFALDEISSLSIKTFFVNARHIMAVQGGMEIPVSLGVFGKTGFQITYIPPFFGSHYIETNNPWGSSQYSTAYVNKGKPISYPLNPDSLELKISFAMDFGKNYTLDLTVKDQMRSAQFAVVNSGMDILTSMEYQNDADYSVKKFFKNIWNNILDVELDVSKRLEEFPLEISVGVQFIMENSRGFELEGRAVPASSDHHYKKINLGNIDMNYGPWNTPSISVLGKVGISLYF